MSKRGKKDNNQKTSIILVGLIVLSVITIIYLAKSLNSNSKVSPQTSSTVTESDGVQYINITAKGGYTPSYITAKANIKTVLRVKTSATFDCSSALVIPSLNYRSNLPPTAVTIIDIPPQEQNSVLRGSCAMGMYRFSIKFI